MTEDGEVAKTKQDILDCVIEGGDTLVEADLSERSLLGIRLPNINLRGASLRNTDLRYAILTGAIMEEVDLSGANLLGAKLTGADLTKAILDNARLDNADFAKTILQEASLKNARMNYTSLRGAILANADFTGADLQNAHLYGAKDCLSATFKSANLRGADMRCTKLDLRELADIHAHTDNRVKGAYNRVFDFFQVDQEESWFQRLKNFFKGSGKKLAILKK